MKRIIFIISVLFVISSCSSGPKYSGMHGEKTQKDAEAEFTASLSSADSTAVLALADKCLSLLQNGSLAEAVDMIYVLHNNVVYQKSASYTSELINRFTILPVVSFKLNYFSFSTEGNNDISYSYSFDSSDPEASSLKLMFNPVYVDGKWYLTFKSGSQSSLDLPVSKRIHEMAPAPAPVRTNKNLSGE